MYEYFKYLSGEGIIRIFEERGECKNLVEVLKEFKIDMGENILVGY